MAISRRMEFNCISPSDPILLNSSITPRCLKFVRATDVRLIAPPEVERTFSLSKMVIFKPGTKEVNSWAIARALAMPAMPAPIIRISRELMFSAIQLELNVVQCGFCNQDSDNRSDESYVIHKLMDKT
ncbi:hypothetical protein ETB97_008480 [Aspergillus alliaceus]|uniref:Uncharacterized protein n=1 Tax=Petromyces alliaceus TaxID=209559 RepID=A0A8H6E1D8_PETAA|nr:hypothetical protein ETB97_008480 [Aspergillus burnettii]